MDGNRKGVEVAEQMTDELRRTRTTIGLKNSTKEKLDKSRAPGQCYDGFICQLVDLWERVKKENQDFVLNPNKER